MTNKTVIDSTRLLGFDVGVTNLAHCQILEEVYDDQSIRWWIESWGNVNTITDAGRNEKMTELSIAEISSLVADALTKRMSGIVVDPIHRPVDRVIIELQPGASRKMEVAFGSIGCCCRTWFRMQQQLLGDKVRVPDIELYNAGCKLRVLAHTLPLDRLCPRANMNQAEVQAVVRAISKNKQNKKDAIYEVSRILLACPSLKSWKDQFFALRKKDDWADGFTQTLDALIRKFGYEARQAVQAKRRTRKAPEPKAKPAKRKAKRKRTEMPFAEEVFDDACCVDEEEIDSDNEAVESPPKKTMRSTRSRSGNK